MVVSAVNGVVADALRAADWHRVEMPAINEAQREKARF